MAGSFFRRRALERVSSPEELDRLVKVALPRSWIALAGLGLLMVAAAVWAVVARVPTTVEAHGYLLREGGIHVGAAPTAGVVVDVLHRPGDRVSAGEILGHVRDSGGSDQAVRAPTGGTLIEVSVAPGDYLQAGRPLALVDPVTQRVVVYAYLAEDDAKRANVGDRVELTSSVADPSQFGFLRGRVVAIAAYPATQERLTSILRDRSVQAEVNELGPVVETLIHLQRDPSTPSKFAWSIGKGPPYQLTIGQPVSASVVTGEQAPIDYVTG
jgi:multidrug efflux pump subunit AcrA (membrane-fusion protein)